MPKLKDTSKQERAKNILSIIECYKVRLGMMDKDLLAKTGMPRQTYQGKKRNPDTFTVADLSLICSILHIPDEERGKMLI